jgi:hypothetical protein
LKVISAYRRRFGNQDKAGDRLLKLVSGAPRESPLVPMQKVAPLSRTNFRLAFDERAPASVTRIAGNTARMAPEGGDKKQLFRAGIKG